MTQKDIIALASDPDLMLMLQEIAFEERNLCHKTIYEQKTAKKKMQNYARDIIDTIKYRKTRRLRENSSSNTGWRT